MYRHFYGFAEEPFRDSPDPRFLFPVPDQQRILEGLIQGIEEKSGWASLIGDPGVGKTVLIHKLLETLKNQDAVKTVFIFQTRISFEDLLRKILSQLNLPPASAGGAAIPEHFSLSMGQILPPGRTLVLFLDEAQDFSVEVLGKISNFFSKELSHPGQIQIIFAGQPLLEEKLESEPLHHLKRRIRFQGAIKPLTALESQHYLHHRLRAAGGNPDLITPEAQNLITRHGEGIPRTLNILCDNAFRIAHQFSEPNISAKIVWKALGEMYPQKAGPLPAWKARNPKSLFKKGFYLCTALIALVPGFFLIQEYAQRDKERQEAKADTQPAKDPKEDSLLPLQRGEERLPLKEEAQLRPSANQIPPESPPETASPVLLSWKKPEIVAPVKKVIRVKEGDTLSNLCLSNYGFANLTLLDQILAQNPDLSNPNRIRPGQHLSLPDIQEESLIQELAEGRTQVFLGTFSRPDFAATFRNEPLLSGKEIHIAPLKIAGGETWYRFSTGVFAEKEEAVKKIRLLRAKHLLPSFGGFR